MSTAVELLWKLHFHDEDNEIFCRLIKLISKRKGPEQYIGLASSILF